MSAEKGRGNAFGIAACEALGIDPGMVTSLTIVISATDIVRVDVSLTPRLSIVAQMNEMLKALADEPRNINVSWSRPILDATTLTSTAREMDA